MDQAFKVFLNFLTFYKIIKYVFQHVDSCADLTIFLETLQLLQM